MQLPQIFHEVGFGVFAVVIDRPVARLGINEWGAKSLVLQNR